MVENYQREAHPASLESVRANVDSVAEMTRVSRFVRTGRFALRLPESVELG